MNTLFNNLQYGKARTQVKVFVVIFLIATIVVTVLQLTGAIHLPKY